MDRAEIMEFNVTYNMTQSVCWVKAITGKIHESYLEGSENKTSLFSRINTKPSEKNMLKLYLSHKKAESNW